MTNYISKVKAMHTNPAKRMKFYREQCNPVVKGDLHLNYITSLSNLYRNDRLIGCYRTLYRNGIDTVGMVEYGENIHYN